MTSPGVELATEWVTLLPETAQLVKKMKEFKPPPIDVELRISKTEAGTEAKAAAKETTDSSDASGSAQQPDNGDATDEPAGSND